MGASCYSVAISRRPSIFGRNTKADPKSDDKSTGFQPGGVADVAHDGPCGKSFDDRECIRRALVSCPSFVAEVQLRKLLDADVDGIIDVMTSRKLSNNEVLFREGGTPEYLYVVSEGEFQSKKGFTTEVVAKKGMVVGESDFFMGSPRSTTVTVSGTKETSIYLLSMQNYKKIVEKECILERRGNDLKKLTLFEGLTDGQLRMLERQIALKDHVKGEMILRKGDKIMVLYIILQGMVREVGDSGEDTRSLGPGDYFGDEAFVLGQSKSSKTFIAINNVSLCGINRETFDDQELFGMVCDRIEKQSNRTRGNRSNKNSGGNENALTAPRSTVSADSQTESSFFVFPVPQSFGWNSIF